MKILAFADTHGSLHAVKEIVQKSRHADIIICAGDLTNFGQKINQFALELSKAKKPILMIPGNHELEKEILSLKNYSITSIHKKTFRFQNFTFFGFGQGGFSHNDPQLEKLIKIFKKTKNLIFVTHSPPYGTVLDYLQPSNHVGSVTVRKFIEIFQPILHICGHIHENAGKMQKLKNTLMINPGPKGKLIEI